MPCSASKHRAFDGRAFRDVDIRAWLPDGTGSVDLPVGLASPCHSPVLLPSVRDGEDSQSAGQYRSEVSRVKAQSLRKRFCLYSVTRGVGALLKRRGGPRLDEGLEA